MDQKLGAIVITQSRLRNYDSSSNKVALHCIDHAHTLRGQIFWCCGCKLPIEGDEVIESAFYRPLFAKYRREHF